MKPKNWDDQVRYHNSVVERVNKQKNHNKYDKHRKKFVDAMNELLPLESRVLRERKWARKNKKNPHEYTLSNDEYYRLLTYVFKIKWQTDRIHFVIRIKELTNKRLKTVLSDANKHQHRRDWEHKKRKEGNKNEKKGK